MSSSGSILASLPKLNVSAKKYETAADFVGDEFNWSPPTLPYNKVPGLPIYIGEGARPPFTKIRFPILPSQKKAMGENALQFTDTHLKPTNAKFIIATTNPRWWESSGYFAATEFKQNGFFEYDKANPEIKWLSFEDEDKTIITIISKRDGDLFHWQIFKGHTLYHETHILFAGTEDCAPVNLILNIPKLEILHDIICEALQDNKVIYNHCAAGIGRSGIITLSELVFIQEIFPEKAPPQLPSSDSEYYYAELLSWAHKNVRPAMLGYASKKSRDFTINLAQLNDIDNTGPVLSVFHRDEWATKKRIPISQRVSITEEERVAIFSRVLHTASVSNESQPSASLSLSL
jgi:hypothetical protein